MREMKSCMKFCFLLCAIIKDKIKYKPFVILTHRILHLPIYDIRTTN